MQLLFTVRAVSQVRFSLIWTTNRKLDEPLPVDPGLTTIQRSTNEKGMTGVSLGGRVNYRFWSHLVLPGG